MGRFMIHVEKSRLSAGPVQNGFTSLARRLGMATRAATAILYPCSAVRLSECVLDHRQNLRRNPDRPGVHTDNGTDMSRTIAHGLLGLAARREILLRAPHHY